MDWEANVAKECGTLKKFETLGEVSEYEEVKDRKYSNVANLLGAYAVKNI